MAHLTKCRVCGGIASSTASICPQMQADISVLKKAMKSKQKGEKP